VPAGFEHHEDRATVLADAGEKPQQVGISILLSEGRPCLEKTEKPKVSEESVPEARSMNNVSGTHI
jgi:hypothetical protein